MKIYKRFFALLLALLAAALLLPVNASAAGSIDLGHTQSLTITAVYADMPISGLRFDPAYLHQKSPEISRFQEFSFTFLRK